MNEPIYSNRELICFLIICLTHDLVSAEILDLRRVSEMFTTLNSSRKIPGFLFQSAPFEVRVVREEKN